MPFTLDAARASVIEKLTKAGAKGVASFATAKTPPEKRRLLDQTIAALESERAIFADRSGPKPRFLLISFAPTIGKVSEKLDQFAAEKHPALLAVADFKKALTKLEKPLLVPALVALEADRALAKLVRGRAYVYAHGESLRAMLGGPVEGARQRFPMRGVQEAYRALVSRYGFPDVEIAQLQKETGMPMAELKAWLIGEYEGGRLVFSFGDWSLANEETRGGAVELHGQRYLMTRLQG